MQKEFLPEQTLKNLKNKPVEIYSYLEEGPMLINFWFLACEPCKKEMKFLDEYQKKYAEYGFNIERYDRVKDFTKDIALVPISAREGEGVQDLLAVVIGLAERYLKEQLEDIEGAGEGTVLEMKEESTGEAEVRETFKISRIGTIAGCMVTSGKILRNSNVRVVRSDELIFEGKLLSLKRFKDDVKEVAKGYDCGIQIDEFNDLVEGDIIQCYQEIAIKRKL